MFRLLLCIAGILLNCIVEAQVRFGIGASNSLFFISTSIADIKAQPSRINPGLNANLKIKVLKKFNIHFYGGAAYQRIKFKNELNKAKIHYEQRVAGVELNYLPFHHRAKLQYYGFLVDFAYLRSEITGSYKDNKTLITQVIIRSFLCNLITEMIL